MLQMLKIDWMARGNLTKVVLADTIERLANLTGVTVLRADKEFWRTVQMLEKRYDIEVFLTGQVFAGPSADTATLGTSKEFWEDFVQDAVRLTQSRLER